MVINHKVFAAAFILACFSHSLFAVTSADELINDYDIDAMFEDAGDTTAVITESPAAQEEKKKTSTLKFSGHLDSELGLGYIFQQGDTNKPAGYFSLNNYLYLDARPTAESTIRGVLGISFPDYNLGLNEFYFDYIIKKRIIFTAGKKSTTWGYPRLFSTATNTVQYQVDEALIKTISAENTNILYDSNPKRSENDNSYVPTTTLMFQVPCGTGTITALALYPGKSTSPSFSDLIFAASVELVIEKTSVNVFGRGGKNEVNSAKIHVGPLLGLEVKRTILDADFYAQGLCRFDSNGKFAKIFNSKNFYEQTFKTFVVTSGFYRWWDELDKPVGINMEYQWVRAIKSLGDELISANNTHSIACETGIKRLGKNRNVKLGIEFSHNITKRAGGVKPGILISNALPNCDWKNGIKWEYGNNLPASGKFTIGSYFSLALNY